MDYTRGQGFCLFQNLSKVLHRSESAVKYALGRLETAGMIRRQRQGIGRPNQIFVLVPDASTSEPESTPCHSQPFDRYYLYLKVRTNAYIVAVKLQETVCYESRFSVNKKSVLHIPSPNTVLTKRDVAVVKSKPIKGSVFYTSDDLRAMVYLSVEHMINHGIEIVRCDNCGRYFVPYSGRARFCNRPVEGGKTCRDVGPWRQYEERVRTDPVAKMLQKNSHAYYMRSWRNGAVYSREDYLRWQLEAKEQLLRYQKGELTQEEALEAIQMPMRK